MNGPEIYGTIFGFQITETIVNTWIIMAIAFVIFYALTRNLKAEGSPGKAQVIGETVVTMMDSLVGSTMGKDKMQFGAYMLSLMMFLVFCNVSGFIGLRAPTADLNVTSTLAIMTFCMIHYSSIKSNGIKRYAKEYIEPLPFLLPMNILEQFTLPLSMGFRVFGNLTGGVIIMGLVYGALSEKLFLGLLIPIPLHFYFDGFVAALQAFVFTMLTMVFVSKGMDQ